MYYDVKAHKQITNAIITCKVREAKIKKAIDSKDKGM